MTQTSPIWHWAARPVDGYHSARVYLVRPTAGGNTVEIGGATFGRIVTSARPLQGVTLFLTAPEAAPVGAHPVSRWLVREKDVGWQLLEPTSIGPEPLGEGRNIGPACCAHLLDCVIHFPPHTREPAGCSCDVRDGWPYSHVAGGAHTHALLQ